MKGFCIAADSLRSYQACSKTTTDNTICSRLRRVFKGPSDRQSTKQPQWKDEKKYHHVPTHARSSFMKTATSPVMVQQQLNSSSNNDNNNTDPETIRNEKVAVRDEPSTQIITS